MSLLTRNGVLGSALREFIAPPASAIALDLDWIASFCGIDRASLRRQNCKEMPTINNDITKDAAGRTHVRTRVQAHPGEVLLGFDRVLRLRALHIGRAVCGRRFASVLTF